MKKPTSTSPRAEAKKKVEKVSEHRLFPGIIRRSAEREAVNAGVDPVTAKELLAEIGDDDIRELGEAFGADDAPQAVEGDGSGHVSTDPENGDVAPQTVGRPRIIDNILARLSEMDPAVKQRIVSALLKLIGI